MEWQVPKNAVVVDFVVFHNNSWDNNGGQDFHFKVDLDGELDVDKLCDAMVPTFFEEIKKEREEREEEERRKREAKERVRRANRDKALAVLRRQTRHVLYTEPEVIKAGSEVLVAYNPQDTNLHGAQKVYIQGGFNRWTHAKQFGPVEMLAPKKGETHFTAVIPVPKDAYKIDFVFCDG